MNKNSFHFFWTSRSIAEYYFIDLKVKAGLLAAKLQIKTTTGFEELCESRRVLDHPDRDLR